MVLVVLGGINMSVVAVKVEKNKITIGADSILVNGNTQEKDKKAKAEKQNAWKKWISTHSVDVDYFSQHVVTEKLRLLEAFLPHSEELFNKPISVTPPVGEPIDPAIVSHLVVPYVVLHPGPLTAYKRWPLAYWQSRSEGAHV